MKPTPQVRDDVVRHHELTDLDFYRRRAAWLRVQAMRDGAKFKPVCFGLLLALAWPVTFAVAASLVHGLNNHAAVQINRR